MSSGYISTAEWNDMVNRGQVSVEEWDDLVADEALQMTHEEAFRAWCKDHGVNGELHDEYDRYKEWCTEARFDPELDSLEEARLQWCVAE
jgi:hypothetical protein